MSMLFCGPCLLFGQMKCSCLLQSEKGGGGFDTPACEGGGRMAVRGYQEVELRLGDDKDACTLRTADSGRFLAFDCPVSTVFP